MTSSSPPVLPPAAAHWQALMQHIGSLHPRSGSTRSVVLLPFVQLLPAAKQAWLAQYPSGLMPRFETSSSWAEGLPPQAGEYGAYSQNRAQDALSARALLATLPSLQDRADSLCPDFLDLCVELAPLAASQPNAAQRATWAQHWAQELPRLLPEGDFLHTERLLQAAAVAWLGVAGFASDALFSPAAGAHFDQLLLVQGLHADPLAQALGDFWQAQGKRVERCQLAAPLELHSPAPAPRIMACADGEDMLARSAYAVLQHLENGTKPVALIAQDRHATRQLRAMLEAQGARIKDETGWKLSTTHAASLLWALLDAALQPANNAAQMAWLHSSLPPDDAGLQQLEKQLGKSHVTLTHNASAQKTFQHAPAALALLDTLAALGQALPLRKKLPLADWQNRLQQALALHGLHTRLQQDEAGAQILRLLEQSYQHNSPLSLQQFAHWLRDVLENAHFLSPSAPQQPDVFILPAAQLLGRSFAAVVWPGVDAQRLPLLPKQNSAFSSAQKQALGLPSAQAHAAVQLQVFLLAMQQPQLSLLWQKMDGEQALAPSPLLQVWQQAQGANCAPLPDLPELPFVNLPTTAQLPPQAQAGALRLSHISASGYAALRRCPYQFFTQQLLGLREADEAEQDPDASDWGQLVHATLADFHQQRQQAGDDGKSTEKSAARDAALLAACAEEALQQLMQQYSQNQAAMLLPYRRSWPQLAAHYLAWLAQDEADGDWHFAHAEYLPPTAACLQLPAPDAPLPLTGRIDRIDRNSAGQIRVIDYKTSNAKSLEKHIQNPLEDTQLPFYALLLGQQQAQLDGALYLAVNEKEACKALEQEQWQDAAAALQAGMQQDIGRIYAGAAMPALGHEEKACSYCPARGLCRKGQWQSPAATPSA